MCEHARDAFRIIMRRFLCRLFLDLQSLAHFDLRGVGIGHGFSQLHRSRHLRGEIIHHVHRQLDTRTAWWCLLWSRYVCRKIARTCQRAHNNDWTWLNRNLSIPSFGFTGKGAGSLIGGYLIKGFGTRPTYQIFAVITLVTGIIYFVFNATYLKKRPQLEGNDIVKKKPKNVNVTNDEKQTNDISLEEKPPQLKEIEKKTQENSTGGRDGHDNGGFLKESPSEKSSAETNEQDSTELEAIRNAKNVDASSTSQPGHTPTEKSDAVHAGDEGNRENSFSNPAFETDNPDQCEITVESQRIDDKRVN